MKRRLSVKLMVNSSKTFNGHLKFITVYDSVVIPFGVSGDKLGKRQINNEFFLENYLDS